MRRPGGSIQRFKAYKAEPDRAYDLAEDHPAVAEGRTLFPGTVKGVFESPRFLVSGKNSPKIGGEVRKGPWIGMPIYTLTLEERATCPTSCPIYAGCYGNAMQWARRCDTTDPDFIAALKAEVVTLVRDVCSPRLNKPGVPPPRGIVIRLHVLGDFYSLEYVRMWADLLDALPELHVFGYTARREDADDAESRKIARALRYLTDEAWDRFAIRWSRSEPGPQRAVVVLESPHDPSIITCPAQIEATQACATCGLCWAPAMRDKTIAFIRHGQKRAGRGRHGGGRERRPDPRGAPPGATIARPAWLERDQRTA
jgi:hypothetical protein